MTTALANKEIGDINESVYIPQQLHLVDGTEENFIHASIDNFDLNEETIDGKGTTHSMAMVIFQKKTDFQSHEDRIKGGRYSLNIEEVSSFRQVEKYNKPAKRPEPPCMKCPVIDRERYEYYKKLNKVWRMMRCFKGNGISISWTTFHDILSKNDIPVSNIIYLPFINNPPTEYDTIYTAMLRIVELANKINQQHVIITADLAIYSKARDILWNKPAPLEGKVTLQMGGMHLTMALLASIGIIFGEGGLRVILTECNVFAANSCKQVLEGKHYNRAVRGFTIVADSCRAYSIKDSISGLWKIMDGMYYLTT